MARAIVPAFAQNFGQPDIADEASGWRAKCVVFYLGSGASGGFMVDTFDTHFLDADTAQEMKVKIREAARTRAAELGVTGAATIGVTSFVSPEKL